MSELLSGKPVAAAICDTICTDAAALAQGGVSPLLCIVRLGDDPSDLSYERGIEKRAAQVGVAVRKEVLPADTAAGTLIDLLRALSADETVHGVLLFRPLPRQLRPNLPEIYAALSPEKDVDGMTDGSAAGIFLGKEQGFAPCTPAACMEILDFYRVDPCGKRAVVVGRSPVVGKPLAMLLLGRNATVTICHTRTKDMAAHTRQAELLLACAGSAELLGAEHIAPGAVVLDVGVNWDAARGALVGDVRFDEAEEAAAITPVPGGVGAVTTAVLLRHVVTAAMRQERKRK